MRAITFLLVVLAIGAWAVPALSEPAGSAPVATPFRFSEVSIDQRMADASLAAAEADEAAAAAIQAEHDAEATTETDAELDAEADAEADSEAEDTPAPAAASPAPADSTTAAAAPVKKSKFVRVTVLSPPPPRHHKKKHKGNFKYRPLLDNGKEYHTKERKKKIDPCTGCYKKPKILLKMVWDKKLHKLVKRKFSKLLPVQPELRDRETKWQKKWRARQARKRIAVSPHHLKPEFYPRHKKWNHKKERAAYLKWRKAHRLKLKKLKKKHGKHHRHSRRNHHKKVLKRLPHVPEFYPKKKAKKIYPPAIRAARAFAKKEKKCREDKKKAREAKKAAKKAAKAAAAAAAAGAASTSTGASA